jgi:DNA-binding SARP family transcriptional activator/tetratricopeptide (TPR) repeat protein/TolB-like protein
MQPTPALQLLGSPGLKIPGRPPAELPAKAYALAALLLLRFAGRAARGVLTSTLWEDAPATRAMADMRQLVARVRAAEREVGRSVFAITRSAIALSAGDLEIDLARLLAVKSIGNEAELNDVIALYRGPLLEGLNGVGVQLDRLVDEERRRIGAHVSDLVLAGAARVGGEPGLEALRHLSKFAPYDEVVCRHLIAALAAEGRHPDVAAAYHDFRSRLRDDLQRQPSAETEELVLRLKRQLAEPTVRSTSRERANPGTEGALPPATSAHPAIIVPRLVVLNPTRTPAAGSAAAFVPWVSALMEDVTIGLCRLRSVAMIAPHSAWQFSKPNVIESVKSYGIDYLLETQVGEDPMDASAARLSVKLVHTETRHIAWADKFRLRKNEAPERHRDLTNWIVRTLADAVEQAELLRHSEMRDPTAYGLYLRGRQHLRALDLPNLRRARKLFAAAIEQAPRFSLPYSSMARTYVFEWLLRAQGNKELLEKAMRLSEQAVALDPFNGDGHRALGRVALYLGDLDASLLCFERAEQYAPHHADLLADYADALMHNSDASKAGDRIELALNLNPLPPDEYLWTAGGVNFFLGRFEEALSRLERMKNQDPALKLLAACAARAGNKAAARRFKERALAINPDFDVEGWIGKLPQRDPRHRKEYADALKAAGFH